MSDADRQRLYGQLPSVEEVLTREETRQLLRDCPRELVVNEIRSTLEKIRQLIRERQWKVDASSRQDGTLTERVIQEVSLRLEKLKTRSLQHVINATGVVLHTNLGRAPLSEHSLTAAREAASGYSNLEYDLQTGRRGKRDVHASVVLERLLGAPAVVVNNNAAAVFLVLNELADGGEVIVSRGELIEIGDGFRIPDIMVRSGARLREVGTTNRTRIDDYREAISEQTKLLLRVHRSNFQIVGFTARPSLEELVVLGRERGLPVLEDLGSGCLYDIAMGGLKQEPLVSDSLRAGVDLVTFSGDKLLGGPQAGIIAGSTQWVQRVRRNPLFRALRVDKLTYAALEATLTAYLFQQYDQIPVLRMIRLSRAEIRERAEHLLAEVDPQLREFMELIEGESVLGGGSTPAQALPTILIAVRAANFGSAARLEERLRRSNPPLIARCAGNRVVLDFRTVGPDEDPVVVEILNRVLGGKG